MGLGACTLETSISGGVGGSAKPVESPPSQIPALDYVAHASFFNSLSDSPPLNWAVVSGIPISEYQYALGSVPGGTDARDWTSAGLSTNLSLSLLSLVEGQTYYLSVKAKGQASDVLSAVMTSTGWLVDVTDPSAPGIPEDGSLQVLLSETNTITWTASTDALSGVDYYEIAIGTTPGATDALAWSNIGNVTSRKVTGLSLVSGTTYYASVRAVDRAGNTGPSASSNGWLAGPFCSNKAGWLTYNASGSGTHADPYLLCNAAQLANIGTTPAALSSVFKLMGDIDLAPYYAAPNAQFRIGACGAGGCSSWDPGVANFTGVFDGGGHTISNFAFSSPGTRGVGFISNTWTGAQIRNLNLTNVSVSGGPQTGGLIGASFSATVHNVSVSGTVTGNDETIGGLVGHAYHLVLGNSSFSGSVSSSGQAVGGLLGLMEDSSIFSSRSSGAVSSLGRRAGGLVGWMSGLTPSRISNSYSTASASGTSEVGGLVGGYETTRGMIQKSYSTGLVSGSSFDVGGLVGRADASTQIKDSYTTSNVNGTTGSGSVGYLVGAANGSISNSYYFGGATCDSTGVGGACGTAGLSHALLSSFYDKSNAPLSSWDDLASSADGLNDYWSFDGAGHPRVWLETAASFTPAFSSGSGQRTDPYIVTSVTEFNKIDQNPRYMNLNFRLANNLDFLSGEFKQVGGTAAAFSGVFDGNGSSLSNISNLKPSEDAVGVFGILGANGRIENLRVNNATISGRAEVGGVIGLVDSSNVVNVIATGGSVTASDENSGGVFGRGTKAAIEKVGSNLSVTGQNYVGGVGGNSFAGSLIQSFGKGNVSGVDRVGGVLGWQSVATFDDNYSTGNVVSTGSMAGGLIGESQSDIYRSYSTSQVTGVSRVGGAVGDAGNTRLEDVFVTGNVSGTSGTAEVGFLVGASTAPTFSNAYYWTGASCDSTGVGGACNTNATSGVADADDFKETANAPLTGWSFPGVWQTVVGQFPKLSFE